MREQRRHTFHLFNLFCIIVIYRTNLKGVRSNAAIILFRE